MKSLLVLYLTLFLTTYLQTQTIYRWTGAVNNNFSVGGNWEPFRQVGQINDVLIFDNSSNLIIENVNQVTVGQIKVINNTSVTLSPSAGNTKTISIHGGDGDDFIVESGSSLRIYGNDPRLNIYIKPGATASIYGTIVIDGNIAHSINTAESGSFRFKSNSLLIQNSPGNVFGTTGVTNAVVFETGSSYRINNPQSLNPFGLAAPNSKVLFEEGSSFVINTHYNNFNLNGRNYPDIVIENGIQVNVSENITHNFTTGSITIKDNAVFRINNISSSVPSFILKGNLNVNGEFSFDSVSNNKLKIHFSGSSVQYISGTGSIKFPPNLEYVFIENDITLNRDLVFNCSVNHVSGIINTNGFTLTINGYFNTPTGSRKMHGVIINQPSGYPPHYNEMNNNNSPKPENFSLGQNYPNPSNPKSKIDFSIPVDAKVTIKVYDVTGREVTTLIDRYLRSDFYTVEFDGTNLPSGIYFYRIFADNGKEKVVQTRKMIMVK
ncbi:MAG: T9SS type A sorting domain-containing protein [Ignavibacteria bacterium]|nr:T9SS type A sorting domain-containing protein [Ignavibacteria bacterium]